LQFKYLEDDLFCIISLGDGIWYYILGRICGKQKNIFATKENTQNYDWITIKGYMQNTFLWIENSDLDISIHIVLDEIPFV